MCPWNGPHKPVSGPLSLCLASSGSGSCDLMDPLWHTDPNPWPLSGAASAIEAESPRYSRSKCPWSPSAVNPGLGWGWCRARDLGRDARGGRCLTSFARGVQAECSPRRHGECRLPPPPNPKGRVCLLPRSMGPQGLCPLGGQQNLECPFPEPRACSLLFIYLRFPAEGCAQASFCFRTLPPDFVEVLPQVCCRPTWMVSS